VTAAVLYALSAIGSAVSLPDRVPLHFALDGSADYYGSRAEAVLGFAALGLGMLALWLLVLQCLRQASLDLFDVRAGPTSVRTSTGCAGTSRPLARCDVGHIAHPEGRFGR
jgi:hypothetical protein